MAGIPRTREKPEKQATETEANSFDPLGETLTAMSSMPESLKPVNLRTLTPFQRALLSIDGTVTRFIEAYTLEPTETVRLDSSRFEATEPMPALDVPEGTRIQTRRVLIRGKYSRTEFVVASSLVVPDRLPSPVGERLCEEGSSIGRLLNEFEMETRREILWFGREPDEDSRKERPEVISRAYRIIANRKPIALIQERFPDVTGLLPVHH